MRSDCMAFRMRIIGATGMRSRRAWPKRSAELHHAGCRQFIEMATTATLIPIAQRALPEAGNLFLTPLHAGADDWAGMNACIAELYVHGAVLDWAEVNKGGRKIHLPTYPFEHRSYWYSPHGNRRSVFGKCMS